MEFFDYKLGDCLSMIENGATIKQKEGAAGYPITRIETLSNDRFNRDRLGYADIENLAEYSNHILENEDLIMSHINSRPFLGRTVIYLKRADEKIIHGMNVLRIKTKRDKLNPFYAYYYFKTPHFRKAIDNIRTDAINQSSINTNNIKDIKIHIPEITKQEEIVNILRGIDKKIEKNEEINSELEAMAKQLYDYWFVQFNFPDENGKPYKSSGGKMVYNSTLKREIPAGWEVNNLNQLAESYRGVTYNKEDLVSESNDSILVLRGNNIPCSGQFAYDSNVAFIPKRMVSKEQMINKGDIIITMSSGSKEHIGKCFMFQNDSDHTYGAFLSKFVPHEEYRYFVYLSMLSDFFKVFVKVTCNGTGINNLTNDTFNNVNFPIPDDRLLMEFETIVESLYNKVGLCQKEIVDLSNHRDSLLPMLMNGQVTVE